MTVYSAVLFLHLAGSLVLFAALVLEWFGVDFLHHAISAEQAHLGFRLTAVAPRLAGPSAAVIVLSGGYLSAHIAGWRQGWVQVSLLTVLVIAVVGIAFSGPQMRALRKVQFEPTGRLPSDVRLRLQDSRLLVSICLRSALLLGVVFLMASRTGFAESLAAMGCAAILGLILAFFIGNQRQKLPSPASFRGERARLSSQKERSKA